MTHSETLYAKLLVIMDKSGFLTCCPYVFAKTNCISKKFNNQVSVPINYFSHFLNMELPLEDPKP